jgi:uncharacterized Zn finger protein
MTASKQTAPGDFQMSIKEFDRIMGQALRVKAEETKKPKRRIKAKAQTKKRMA